MQESAKNLKRAGCRPYVDFGIDEATILTGNQYPTEFHMTGILLSLQGNVVFSSGDFSSPHVVPRPRHVARC